jgi:hypothetical protein
MWRFIRGDWCLVSAGLPRAGGLPNRAVGQRDRCGPCPGVSTNGLTFLCVGDAAADALLCRFFCFACDIRAAICADNFLSEVGIDGICEQSIRA